MTDDWWRLDMARDGDESAWQSLFERHYQGLVRMALFITGSLESAQDVAQETFVSLLRANIHHRNGSLKSFLSTIAYRLSLKERARLHAQGKLDAHPIIDESPSVLENAVQDETDRLIVHALQGLPLEYREVLTLRFFGEHSYEEIAQIMEIPIGTVKSRIFYGIKGCREKLRGQGVFA
jgi:RNA polymerase sigma-70 factor (ECF subfamily)